MAFKQEQEVHNQMKSTLPVNCCTPLAGARMSNEEAHSLAALFKSLSDLHRVRIVNLLATSSDPVCVCDLTAALGLGQPTVSHHLKKLMAGGLIEREQRGTWAYYSLRDDALEKLAGLVGTTRKVSA